MTVAHLKRLCNCSNKVLLNSLHASKLMITANYWYTGKMVCDPSFDTSILYALSIVFHPNPFYYSKCMIWICVSHELHISVEVASQCTFSLAECSLALLSTAEIYVTAVGCACG